MAVSHLLCEDIPSRFVILNLILLNLILFNGKKQKDKNYLLGIKNKINIYKFVW